MTNGNPNFDPRSESDRNYASFRTGGDRRHTRVAVELEGGDIATEFVSIEELMLLELRAIRIGISYMTERDLLQDALTENTDT